MVILVTIILDQIATNVDWITTLSPRFFLITQDNSDLMPSAKPTKLITSPTSTPSSTDTPQSSQIHFQSPSAIPIPLLSTVTSPCTSTFPSFPTPTTHSLFSAPPSMTCHHLVPHLHQKYYLKLQILFYMLRSTLLKKCKYHLPYPT